MSQSGPTSFDPLAAVQPTLETPLSRILAERIQRDGPITFAEWMRQCLYHPQHGYYRRGAATVGRDGDFLTSPEVHPIFGAAVGHVAAELWRQCEERDSFRIAEIGPGSGALAESLLRSLLRQAPDLAASVRYTLVEPDRRSAAQQRERLRSIHNVRLVNEISEINELGDDLSDGLGGGHQLIVANELLDALPVHRLQRSEGRWRELLVDFSPSTGFRERVTVLRDERLRVPLAGIEAAEGQIVEVAPGRAEVVAALAAAVGEGGLLLLFDYGYPRDRLYARWRREGTLMTFRKHIPGDDPYAHAGEQDITAHIDIDQVREAARAAGLTPLPMLSQAEWLHHLGATAMPAVADAKLDTNAYLGARRAVETLTDPGGLGRIAVLGFTRGSLAPLPGWSAS